MPLMLCPLCQNTDLLNFNSDKKRDYLRCNRCQLVFVPPSQHLSLSQEKAIYDFHQNHGDDPGYRKFLSRLCIPLTSRLKPKSNGLDFGCGPGPVLAQMLTDCGHQIDLYDPFYANQPGNLKNQYDFIVCTEVIEHFRQPQIEFEYLFCLLNSTGILGIMTKLVIDSAAFSRWHYKNDPTHLCFFSKTTLEWLANQYNRRIEFIDKDVILFSKPDSSDTS